MFRVYAYLVSHDRSPEFVINVIEIVDNDLQILANDLQVLANDLQILADDLQNLANDLQNLANNIQNLANVSGIDKARLAELVIREWLPEADAAN